MKQDTGVREVFRQLSMLDVRSWNGLPAVDWRSLVDDDHPLEQGVLGEEAEAAAFLRLEADAGDETGRLWIRDDAAVLADVPAVGDAPIVDVVGALGEPELRLDVQYKLLALDDGEWVYAARGLSFVVEGRSHIVHALGFAPCPVEHYRRRLRVRFGVTRRPGGHRLEGDL